MNLNLGSYKINWTGKPGDYPNVNNDLLLCSQLGKGSFAVVYEGQDKKMRKTVAVKVYDKKKLNSSEKREFTQNEINVMLKIGSHPSIARLWRVIEDSKNIFLIQEVAGKKALSDVIRAGPNKRLSEPDARLIFRQLVSAVSFVHKLGICHRDLKMTNILVNDKKKLKLIDFGFSTMNRANFRTYCGTPSYMAPE